MKLENYLSQSGTDFLSRSESGGFENLTESRHGICESAVWVYFQDYHKCWLDGGDPEYTEELCMNDLALMIIVGDQTLIRETSLLVWTVF